MGWAPAVSSSSTRGVLHRQDDRLGGRRSARRAFTRASSSRRSVPSIRAAAAFSFTSAAFRSASAASKVARIGVSSGTRSPALARRMRADPALRDRHAASRHAGAPLGDIRAGRRLPRFGDLQVLGSVPQPDWTFVRLCGHGLPPHSNSAVTRPVFIAPRGASCCSGGTDRLGLSSDGRRVTRAHYPVCGSVTSASFDTFTS
jgi:hypothetical protein